MNIIFLGSPGSGKGTQADLIAKRMNFFHFSSGQMLRDMKDSKPEIQEIMKSGQMVPDSMVIELIEEYLEKLGKYDDIIFDGSPRNLYQYGRMKEFLSLKNTQFDLAVCINISDEEIIRRLTARRVDKKTGIIYNLITNPPGTDVDLNDLVQREDDTEEAVRNRIKGQKVSDDYMEAVLKDGILFMVDGEQPIEDIYKKIMEKVESMRK